jgi:hypothetical protein
MADATSGKLPGSNHCNLKHLKKEEKMKRQLTVLTVLVLVLGLCLAGAVCRQAAK